MKTDIIYLDAHATTPVDPQVLQTMLPYFSEHFGNGNHKAGWRSNYAIELARNQVASLLKAKPSEVIFTSGATEAVNLGLLGLARANRSDRNHIVTQKTEHPAVLNTIASLTREGYEVTMLDVDELGTIDLVQLQKSVSTKTLVVAIMLANNEIGTIQPVKEIGEICRNVGAKFFCDITQGLGWYPINVEELNIDLAAMSSHKIYGPRGIGALYMRRTKPPVLIEPISFGGGQENGFRSGTLNLPGIVGFGKACEIQQNSMATSTPKIQKLRDRLQEIIQTGIPGVVVNGNQNNRHPGNLNLSIPNCTGEQLIGQLPNFIFSTGSACSSASTEASHVIAATKPSEEVLHSSFRFGISKLNTITEIEFVGQSIIDTVAKIHQSKMRKMQMLHSA